MDKRPVLGLTQRPSLRVLDPELREKGLVLSEVKQWGARHEKYQWLFLDIWRNLVWENNIKMSKMEQERWRVREGEGQQRERENLVVLVLPWGQAFNNHMSLLTKSLFLVTFWSWVSITCKLEPRQIPVYSKDPQEEDKTTEWPGKEPEMRKGLDDSTVYEGHSHNWS